MASWNKYSQDGNGPTCAFILQMKNNHLHYGIILASSSSASFLSNSGVSVTERFLHLCLLNCCPGNHILTGLTVLVKDCYGECRWNGRYGIKTWKQQRIEGDKAKGERDMKQQSRVQLLKFQGRRWASFHGPDSTMGRTILAKSYSFHFLFLHYSYVHHSASDIINSSS